MPQQDLLAIEAQVSFVASSRCLLLSYMTLPRELHITSTQSYDKLSTTSGCSDRSISLFDYLLVTIPLVDFSFLIFLFSFTLPW